MLSWLGMLRGMVNYNLADRIDSYNQGFIQGDYCDWRSRAEACPLTCSVVRSASNGFPWKEDKSSLRRGSQDKPFNPRRSAYEVQSSSLKLLKQSRPWYKSVNADVLQQALRHLDTAFNRFFQGQANFPRFKSGADFKSFEFKPKTVQVRGNHIIFPTLGDMRFFKSREIPQSWEIRTATVTREADGWYVSLLLRDDTVPDLSPKTVEELRSVNGVDRGLRKIAALADGEVELNPSISKRFARRLEIRQRRLSRKAHHSSQECSQCHFVSPTNRDGEKFVCENCAHHEDADVDAAVVIAQRTVEKLGIASLRVVSPKVTPKPEVTGYKEISPALAGEPGNQTGNQERVTVTVQLSLFEDVSGESPSIPLCG